MFKVWTATYALTHGIIELKVEESSSYPDLLFHANGFKSPVDPVFYFVKRSECHIDRAAAVKEANQMRDSAIECFEANLLRLRNLKF